MIFVKSILGGIVAVCLMWFIIVAVYFWRLPTGGNRGNTGLTAVASGWAYLLHLPVVITLLTFAFGLGLWFVSHR